MQKVKVLYVEDEPFLAKIVKESLESRSFEVEMVTDGLKVAATLNRFCPDICVLDVMLPGKDGFAIARDIRQQYPALPILFVTARIQTEDVLKGFSSGGNDYIRKPFSMEELIVRMGNLIQMTQGVKPVPTPDADAPKQIGRFEFSTRKYELRLGNQVRKLSHREAELLSILTEQPHMTVNRRDILLRIWGDDSFFNSRNLDVYITKLREYFKDDPSIEIMTIKGVGYRFVTE